MKIVGKSLSEGVTGARVGERIETRRERRLKGGGPAIEFRTTNSREDERRETVVTHSVVGCVCVRVGTGRRQLSVIS